MSKSRSLLVALSGLVAAVMGTLWWWRRSPPVVPEIVPREAAAAAVVEAPPSIEIAAPTCAVPMWVVTTLRLISAGAGLAMLMQMQTLLLAARMPFEPALLFILGVLLILPLAANHRLEIPQPLALPALTSAEATGKGSRLVYFAAAIFFVFASLFVAQFGRITILLVLLWLLGIIAVLSARLRLRVDWRALLKPETLIRFAPDVAVALLVPLVLGVLMRVTFAPEVPIFSNNFDLELMETLANGEIPLSYGDSSPFYMGIQSALAGPTRELADLQRFSGIFALVLVPAVYVFAGVVYGRWAGLFAAGFAAAGLWTLALAKSGGVYPALAVCGALYLSLIFLKSPQQPLSELDKARDVFAGLVLGIGWLLSPQFAYMALLLPVRGVFIFLDDRPEWWTRALQTANRFLRRRLWRPAAFAASPLIIVYRWWRAQKGLPSTGRALLVAAVVVLPFVRIAADAQWLPLPQISPDFEFLTGIPPLYAMIDALAYGLLLFNLSRDPSPVHGIINRPAFLPLLGALFIVGLLAWAWRIYRTQRWREGWLLAALIVTLLPAAVNLPLPLAYPDSWRAAIALPVAVCIAAYGAAIFADSLQRLLGRIGIGVAIVLFSVSVWFIAIDAREHYNNIAVPAYEQAAPYLSQSPH